jgi:hypothetical protein
MTYIYTSAFFIFIFLFDMVSEQSRGSKLESCLCYSPIILIKISHVFGLTY